MAKRDFTRWEINEKGIIYGINNLAVAVYKPLPADTAPMFSGNLEKCEANAKLIAAAPELLESLERLENFVTRCYTLEGRLTTKEIEVIVGHARKAIFKATN